MLTQFIENQKLPRFQFNSIPAIHWNPRIHRRPACVCMQACLCLCTKVQVCARNFVRFRQQPWTKEERVIRLNVNERSMVAVCTSITHSACNVYHLQKNWLTKNQTQTSNKYNKWALAHESSRYSFAVSRVFYERIEQITEAVVEHIHRYIDTDRCVYIDYVANVYGVMDYTIESRQSSMWSVIHLLYCIPLLYILYGMRRVCACVGRATIYFHMAQQQKNRIENEHLSCSLIRLHVSLATIAAKETQHQKYSVDTWFRPFIILRM